MRPSYSDELPPDLLRQLEAIERSANAQELERERFIASTALWEKADIIGPKYTPERHALDAELRRARRESRRVRTITIAAMLIGVVVAALGTLAHQLDHYILGLIMLGVGGTLIGLGAVSAYSANARIQDLGRRVPNGQNR